MRNPTPHRKLTFEERIGLRRLRDQALRARIEASHKQMWDDWDAGEGGQTCECGCGRAFPPSPPFNPNPRRYATKWCRERTYRGLEFWQPERRECECGCGVAFIARHSRRRFASERCRWRWRKRVARQGRLAA